MIASLMIRRSAAGLLAAALGLAALPGCGGSSPQPATGEKKEEPKPNPSSDPNTTNPNPLAPISPPKQPDGPPPNTLGKVEPAAEQAATAFLRDLGQGSAKANVLSAAFVRAVGQSPEGLLPSDKARGYSEDIATSWLRKVGEGVNFFPSLKQEQVGDAVVYIRGSMTSPRLGKEANKSGAYCLRLLKDGGAWKVDWLSLSSVDSGTVTTTTAPTPEGAAQTFAVAAFVELVADLNGMPRDERNIVLAAAMTPTLRAAWAPPFNQDKAVGFDYNPGILGTAAVAIGGGTRSFTAARVGDLPEFKVVLTKPAGPKTYAVKLVKGAAPHEWLVNEVTETKG